jgi:Ca2+-binding EF-hand superfamily protein
LCIALDNPLGPAELHDAFRTMDIDKNGCISWKEFIKYWETT